MSKPVIFERLPVGACYAYESKAPKATRKKVDTKHVTIIPGSNRTYRVEDVEMRVHEKACPTNFGRRRKGRGLGSTERFIVRGPASWPSSYHTSKNDAIAKAQACSKKHPNAICKVTEGLPGMQRTVAECNRNECWKVSGAVGKRRRRKARRK